MADSTCPCGAPIYVYYGAPDANRACEDCREAGSHEEPCEICDCNTLRAVLVDVSDRVPLVSRACPQCASFVEQTIAIASAEAECAVVLR